MKQPQKIIQSGNKQGLESALQSKCLSILNNEIGGMWFKLHTGLYSRKGSPDIIGVRKGIAYAIEIKRPDGKGSLSALQEHKLSKFKENGGVAVSIHSIEELREIFSG